MYTASRREQEQWQMQATAAEGFLIHSGWFYEIIYLPWANEEVWGILSGRRGTESLTF